MAATSAADASHRKAERLESKIEPLETQLSALSQSQQEMSQTIAQELISKHAKQYQHHVWVVRIRD